MSTVSFKLLAGKFDIITGGTTGIGHVVALEFVRQGVIVNYIDLPSDLPHLQSLVAEAEAIHTDDEQASKLYHLAGDVRDPTTSPEPVNFAVSKSPNQRLNIYVSNAGICRFAEFFEISADLFANTVNTNFSGSFYVVQAAGRQMASQQPSSGSIIGISSISSLISGGMQAHYTRLKPLSCP